MKKILVVDDQPLEFARRESPDLVIVDIMMPGGMDGFETVQQLRSDPAIPECPVLILTAKDQQSERSRAVEMNVDGYLSKPFHLDDLQGQVGKLIA